MVSSLTMTEIDGKFKSLKKQDIEGNLRMGTLVMVATGLEWISPN